MSRPKSVAESTNRRDDPITVASRAIAFVAALAATSTVIAGGELTGLGATNVTGMSADGSVIVGNNAGTAYMWTAGGGVTDLGGLGGDVNVSADGGTIVGDMNDGGTIAAAIWLTGTQWQSLGGLTGGAPCGDAVSNASGVSGDGLIVVGGAWLPACEGHGFRWESGGPGMTDLGSTVPGRNSHANGIADDASTIVGWQDSATGFRQGARWEGAMQSLFVDGLGNPVGEATATTPDGTVIVGGHAGDEAWVWTDAGGIVPIGNLPGTSFQATATDVSDDGTIVIGYAGFGPDRDAFIWTEAMGMVKLDEYLANLGVGGLTGWDLTTAAAISGDGTIIAGWGTGPSGPEAWVVTLPVPCPADVNGDGTVDVLDLLDVLTAWGPCPGCSEDVNGDGTVDVLDLLDVLTAWGACP